MINHQRRTIPLGCTICGQPRHSKHTPFCLECKTASKTADAAAPAQQPANPSPNNPANNMALATDQQPAKPARRVNYYRYLHRKAKRFAAARDYSAKPVG